MGGRRGGGQVRIVIGDPPFAWCAGEPLAHLEGGDGGLGALAEHTVQLADRIAGRGEPALQRLDRLARIAGLRDGRDLDQGSFDLWCDTLRHLDANTRRARQRIVRKFCLYRQRAEPGRFVFNPLYFARLHPGRMPVIVGPEHVARRFAATEVGNELRAHLSKRLALSLDVGSHAPLLCNIKGGLRGYTGTRLSGGIHVLFKIAGVHDSEGQRPRIHDLRHSFVVQALLRWYRDSADVQSNLPRLAMYMGHVSIVSTAHYLHFVPALAELASDRFEKSFGNLIEEMPR